MLNGLPSVARMWAGMSFGFDSLAGDEQDCVALLEVRRSGRAARHDGADHIRVPLGCNQEERREDDDRKEQVHRRPGKDRRQPAPGRLAPVRVGRQRPLELLPGPASSERRAQCVDLGIGGAPVLALECIVEPRELCAMLLARLGCERRSQVARRRAIHPGNLHVSPERDRPDPVLDLAAGPLRDRRSEADVELARRHSDGPRGEEVTRLVDHHEHRQSGDRRDQAHAASTSSRARPSASRNSSTSRASAPSTCSSTSATSAGMSRKPIRPSRNAATATSLAAL